MALTMRQWRRARDYSQEYMAKKLNVHINTYMNWEKAPDKIKINYAKQIADILAVPMNEIIFAKEVET